MSAVVDHVLHEDELEPVRDEGDTATSRVSFDSSNGCEHLEQRLIRFAPGRSRDRTFDGRQEVLFVVSGQGELELDGNRHELAPNTAVFIASGESYAVDNAGPDELLVVSVLAPEDRIAAPGERKVTTERTFHYLVNEDAGCLDVTQFLGIVQPSKAPFHSHSYDEVGYVLAGEGFAHVGGRTAPLRAGSCFHLPPDEVHCIENSGTGPMHILGVFHPSGSPANRAYPGNK
jgi:quercetin dioxygenase-like cupin family protein